MTLTLQTVTSDLQSVRFDEDRVKQVTFVQESGFDTLIVAKASEEVVFIQDAVSHSAVKLQLNWYGQRDPVFECSLRGSSSAISEV